MTIHYNKTQTWDHTTPNNGELFDVEFDQIYTSIRDLAGSEQNPEEITSDHTIIRHRGWGDKRQTILFGKTAIDTSDTENNVKAAFLTAGSLAKSVKIDCEEKPLTVALSGGYDQWGAVEYTVTFQNSGGIEPVEWTNFSGDMEYFLFIEIDPATNNVSYGTTQYVPVYSNTAPGVTINETVLMTGQHWFDLNDYIMKVWDGTDWIPETRIFLGEARCSTSGIDKIISYALRGEYEFNWLPVLDNSKYELYHNIGTVNISCEVYVRDEVSGDRLNNEESLRYCDFQYYYNGNGGGMGASKRIQRNTVIIGIGQEFTAYYATSADTVASATYNGSGEYKIRVKRTF